MTNEHTTLLEQALDKWEELGNTAEELGELLAIATRSIVIPALYDKEWAATWNIERTTARVKLRELFEGGQRLLELEESHRYVV